MSRAAEERAEREMVRDREECGRLMVVGAIVWRARFDRLEKGVIRAATRCNHPDHGAAVGGKYPYWAAQFIGSNPTGCPADFNGDWESQTYSWRFFLRKEDAHKALIHQVERRLEDKQREVTLVEILLFRLRAEAAQPVRNDSCESFGSRPD